MRNQKRYLYQGAGLRPRPLPCRNCGVTPMIAWLRCPCGDGDVANNLRGEHRIALALSILDLVHDVRGARRAAAPPVRVPDGSGKVCAKCPRLAVAGGALCCDCAHHAAHPPPPPNGDAAALWFASKFSHADGAAK